MTTLTDRVQSAKTDPGEREALLRDFEPFILSCASRQSGKYIQAGIDDEASIAFMAFDEAIDSYAPGKSGFLSFAKWVISRRLIDRYRKEKTRGAAIPLDFSDGENPTVLKIDGDRARSAHRMKLEEEERRWEIEAYKRELSSWGIAFPDLVGHCPRHSRLREEYKELAKFIMEEDILLEELMRTHRLPIAKILKKRRIPRKKLERGRIYILSVIVALTGDYRYIREYIDWR